MKRILASVPLLGAALLLGACSSAPTRFYTLTPQSTASTPAGDHASYQFSLLPVTIPAQVDQPQLIIRQSDDRVALLEGEQWIGPLNDQIRSAVSDRLQQRLGATDVYGLSHVGDKPVYKIKLDVRRFESVPDQYALISAAWSVHGKDDKQTVDCTETVKQPVGRGYSALVQGHQRALQMLADHMAAAVQSLAQGKRSTCPEN